MINFSVKCVLSSVGGLQITELLPSDTQRINKYFHQKIDRSPVQENVEKKKKKKFNKIMRDLFSPLENQTGHVEIKSENRAFVYILSSPGMEYGKSLFEKIQTEMIAIEDIGQMSISDIIKRKREELSGQDRYIYHFSISHLIGSEKIISWSELNNYFPYYSDVSFQMRKDGKNLTFQDYLLQTSSSLRELLLPSDFNQYNDVFSFVPLLLKPMDSKQEESNKGITFPGPFGFLTLPHPNQQNRNESSSYLNDVNEIFKHTKRPDDKDRKKVPHIIEGDAGQGKSMLLRHYFFLTNETQRDNIAQYLPCWKYHGSSIRDFIMNSFDDLFCTPIRKFNGFSE